jgi:hypothetical protein
LGTVETFHTFLIGRIAQRLTAGTMVVAGASNTDALAAADRLVAATVAVIKTRNTPTTVGVTIGKVGIAAVAVIRAGRHALALEQVTDRLTCRTIAVGTALDTFTLIEVAYRLCHATIVVGQALRALASRGDAQRLIGRAMRISLAVDTVAGRRQTVLLGGAGDC